MEFALAAYFSQHVDLRFSVPSAIGVRKTDNAIRFLGRIVVITRSSKQGL